MENTLGNFNSLNTPAAQPAQPASPAPDNSQASDAIAQQQQARQQQMGALESQVTPMPKIPSQPQNGMSKEDLKSHTGFFAAMLLMSVLASKKTATPMTAAMNNMTASLKGMVAGNQMIKQQQNADMWKNFDAAMEQHKSSIESYKIGLEKMYKDPKNQQYDLYLQLLQHGYAPEMAAKMSDPKTAGKIYESKIKATGHVQTEAANLKASQAKLDPNFAKAAIEQFAQGDTITQAVPGWGKAGIQQRMAVEKLYVEDYIGKHPDATPKDAMDAQMNAHVNRVAKTETQKTAVRQAYTKYNNYQTVYATLDKNMKTWDSFASGLSQDQSKDAQAAFSETADEMNKSGVTSIDAFKNMIMGKTNDPQVIQATILGYDSMTEYAKLIAGGAQSAAQVPVAAMERAAHAFNMAWDKEGRQAAIQAITASSDNILGSQMEAVNRAGQFAAIGHVEGDTKPSSNTPSSGHPNDIQDLLNKYGK